MILQKIINRLQNINHHRTTQVYFISYPKVGTTWTRFLLGRYMQLVCASEELFLFDSRDRWGRCERACIGPAIHFTHAPLTWLTQTGADLNFKQVVKPFINKKIVLIVRHPLDALVSSWFQATYRDESFTGKLPNFLDDPVFGLEKCLRFYNLWAAERAKVSALLLLRYEELRADTTSQFQSLLDFLNIVPDDGLVQAAIEYASFENMRSIEASGHTPQYKSSGSDVFATGDLSNTDSYHVRRGKVGRYKDYLSAEEVVAFETKVKTDLDSWYGYSE